MDKHLAYAVTSYLDGYDHRVVLVGIGGVEIVIRKGDGGIDLLGVSTVWTERNARTCHFWAEDDESPSANPPRDNVDVPPQRTIIALFPAPFLRRLDRGRSFCP